MSKLTEDAHHLIERLATGARDDAARDALLARIAAHQAVHVPAYGRLCRARPSDPLGFPALPTDVFRFTRVAAHPPDRDVRVFHTSGTTKETRGTASFADLSLYDRAARAAGKNFLFSDVGRIELLVLAASDREVPDSSLSYMLSRFVEWFGTGRSTYIVRDGKLEVDLLRERLDAAIKIGVPVALLGTSFAFVHAEETLGDRRFALPPRSRIMQTGGFKGRSREVERGEMLMMLSARYGVRQSAILAEYGMTELASQMYESATPVRRLVPPPWVRATPVDPETLAPMPPGEIGILRIDDVASIDTICALQTSDLARTLGDGIEVLGRATDAVARGCSIAADAALSRGEPAREAGSE